MQELIYLASAYSAPDGPYKIITQEINFQEVLRISAVLMKRGLKIFSPIVHCHPIATKYGLPTDWAYWKDYLHAMLPRCDKMYILDSTQSNWRNSVGIKGEFELATELKKQVFIVNTHGLIRPWDDTDYFLI